LLLETNQIVISSDKVQIAVKDVNENTRLERDEISERVELDTMRTGRLPKMLMGRIKSA